MMTWTDEQIDSWCLAWQAYREEESLVHLAREYRTRRWQVQQDILRHLAAFIDGRSTLADFNAILQQQTHYDWNLFGLRGASAGMFLNKLVKYIPHDEQLTHHLRMALPLPQDTREGQHRMQALTLFLEGILTTGQISRAQLQPAHLPYFLSVWWHIQEAEEWPRFSGQFRRHILSGLPLADPLESPIDLYFAFRERFLALKSSFGISAWELEHFLRWQEQQEKQQAPTPNIEQIQQEQEKHPMAESGKGGRGNLPSGQARRLYSQWLLAKIGNKVGCQVWIARQDHEKSWNNELFQQLSIPSLPFAEESAPKTLLEQVAVLWLRKNEVIAAYEVDPKNTEIVASLLRLYDLGVACARRQTRLCLVLPKQQFEQACLGLAHPLFRQQQEKQQCTFISIEDLANQAEHILRWATSPTIIEDLLVFPEHVRGNIQEEKAY